MLRENPIRLLAVDFLMLPVDCGAMISWLFLVRCALTGMVRSQASLAAENAILRHQVTVLPDVSAPNPGRPGGAASSTWEATDSRINADDGCQPQPPH